VPDKKATTYYSGPIIEVYLPHSFPLSEEDMHVNSPRPQPIQEIREKNITTKQSREPPPEVVTKEQFMSERQLVRSTNISPQPIWLSQWAKI
jgi:hypothetical protein